MNGGRDTHVSSAKNAMHKEVKILNGDDEHEFYQALWRKIHEFVDEQTKDLHPENDYNIRDRLTSEFRFWRRP